MQEEYERLRRTIDEEAAATQHAINSLMTARRADAVEREAAIAASELMRVDGPSVNACHRSAVCA